MALKIYQLKRNFKKTQEPKGKKPKSATDKIFVIQKHAASHLHYDFRLEVDGVLKSWAVPKGPSLDPKIKRLAVQVEDHPIEYGSFEGTIPKGEYGGGTVLLWDVGIWLDKSSIREGYSKNHLIFELKGRKLKGLWSLIRFKKSDNNWLLIKINDKYAKKQNQYDIIQKKPLSVVSGKSIIQIAKKSQEVYSEKKQEKNDNFDRKVKIDVKNLTGARKKTQTKKIFPALATLVMKAPQGKQWIHEIKLDGYRIIAMVNKKKIGLFTRHQHNWTDKFPKIKNALMKLNLPLTTFDGEVVVLDKKGVSNFQLLQNAIKSSDNTLIIYFIFDIIYHNGYDLSLTPLLERKKLLQQLLAQQTNIIRFNEYIVGVGEKIFHNACKLSLEGIVSKMIDSPYMQKRTLQWLKTKCSYRQEFVVGGYTKPKGSRSYFGSLLLGYYTKEKKLQYCGKVGTGYTEDSLAMLNTLLQKYRSTKNYFDEIPPDLHTSYWVKPNIVVEVEFLGWTNAGILRNSSFEGLHEDKKPKEVVLEKPKLHP